MPIRAEIERIADELPVAMYLVSESGRFIFGNRRLRELLNLPDGDISTLSIEQYYVDPRVRQEMLKVVRSTGMIEKRGVRLKAGKREIEAQMFCREARADDGSVLGFIGVLVERTAEAEFQHVFNAHLPAGVYRLDADDRVTHANLAFAQMHGFTDIDAILGQNVRMFYAHQTDADRIKSLIIERQELHRERITLRKWPNGTFEAYLTAIPFFNGNQYAGRGGVVEDRTSEEHYQRIFDDIPVGLYVAETRDGKDIVVHCNEEFARIHDVKRRDDMIGRDLRNFHVSPKESERYLKEIVAVASVEDTVRGAHLLIRTDNDVVKTLEINARPQMIDGKLAGRTGAVRDITDEVAMRDTIRAMTNDIGAILHTLKHTLAQLKHTIASVADATGGAPATKAISPTPDQLEAQVRAPLRELSGAVEALVTASNTVTHRAALDRDEITKLHKLIDVMQRATRDMPPAHWRDIWLQAAVRIEHICGHVRPGTIARSAYRPVVTSAQRISKITALATLGSARELIEEIDVPLTSFRDFVTSGARTIDQGELVNVEDCVRDAINSVTGFADERRVQVRFDEATHTVVKVSRREVTRALSNLVHNAIKYSWRREDDKTWIGVSVTINDRAHAVVAIENWGVPIPREEIARGLVFRLGFRGRLSSDRGRVGTGVGLADSLRVAQAHGGDLRITSRPASPSTDADDYSAPFITTAYFELPLAREGASRK
jgi:PAS domain S-box-containing protein